MNRYFGLNDGASALESSALEMARKLEERELVKKNLAEIKAISTLIKRDIPRANIESLKEEISKLRDMSTLIKRNGTESPSSYTKQYNEPRSKLVTHMAPTEEPVSIYDPPTVYSSSNIKLPNMEPAWKALKPQTKIGVWVGVAAVGTGLFFLLRKKKRK
jgi:LPXTG-motif cell wall-anchored protein